MPNMPDPKPPTVEASAAPMAGENLPKRPHVEMHHFRHDNESYSLDKPLVDLIDAFRARGSGGLQIYLFRLEHYTAIRQEEYRAGREKRDLEIEKFGIRISERLSKVPDDYTIDDQLSEESELGRDLDSYNRSLGDFDDMLKRRSECVGIYGEKAVRSLDAALGIDLQGLTLGDDCCVLGVDLKRLSTALTYYNSMDYWFRHPQTGR